MYHRFSGVTGRLVSASSLQSIRPTIAQKSIPAITYDSSVKITPLEISVRSQSNKVIPGTNIPCSPLDEGLKKKMELFQADNDIPVHLKGGATDQILYRLTMGLMVAGCIGVGFEFFNLAQTP